MMKPKVFLTSSSGGLPIARALMEELESTAVVTLWSDQFSTGLSTTHSLGQLADRSDYAVVVLSPDENAISKKSMWSPRQNVVFEMGLLAGKLGLSRIFVVVTDPSRTVLPSDLAGILYLPLVGADENPRRSVSEAARAIRQAIKDSRPSSERSAEFYTCFLSYSWQDKSFAVRLYDDLRDAGIDCWLDEKEMKAGDSISEQIGRAIQVHDKVLLILSDSSLRSSWVRLEVRNALKLERDRHKTILFPIALDSEVFRARSSNDFKVLQERYIPDFSGWQEPSEYKKAFSRLVRDLAIRTSVESSEGPR